jgi:germination protein M
MKKYILTMLIAALLFAVSSCSLLNDNAASTTQQDNSAAVEKTGNEQDVINSAENTQAVSTLEVQGKKVEVTLYFATEDNSAVKKEKREVTVIDGAIIRASVEALLEGPQTAGLHKTIPDGTSIRGINFKDNVAIVDFTNAFNSANGMEEITSRASIVNTLTGITGVDKVKIMVEGEDTVGMSGKPYGEMARFALDSKGLPVSGN